MISAGTSSIGTETDERQKIAARSRSRPRPSHRHHVSLLLERHRAVRLALWQRRQTTATGQRRRLAELSITRRSPSGVVTNIPREIDTGHSRRLRRITVRATRRQFVPRSSRLRSRPEGRVLYGRGRMLLHQPRSFDRTVTPYQRCDRRPSAQAPRSSASGSSRRRWGRRCSRRSSSSRGRGFGGWDRRHSR